MHMNPSVTILGVEDGADDVVEGVAMLGNMHHGESVS